jgi:hypothetical protein
MKFFLRGRPLNRRFWFASGCLLTVAIVLLWGIPALIRTKGEFFWVGIGRHVVERSFGALEGHGGQTLSSYFLTLPFYFGTVFFSFFPWSIKLPALTKHLWRRRDGIDTYLIMGTAIIFLLMTIVKTKLPHYTLTAFPLLSLLLARHIFELRSFFAQLLRRFLPNLALTRRLLELPPSRRFAVRAAVGALILWLAVSLLVFPIAARNFPTVQLFEKAKNDLQPEMHFGNVDYAEPSVVWYFRSRVHGFSWSGRPQDVKAYMAMAGPKFIIVPTDVAKAAYPELPPGWKSHNARGFNFAKGKSADLTLIVKPAEEP